MSIKLGQRVGCVHRIETTKTKRIIHFLGYGKIITAEVPKKEAVGPQSDLARSLKTLIPKFELDSGETIYATECYWARSTYIRKKVLNIKPRNKVVVIKKLSVFALRKETSEEMKKGADHERNIVVPE